MAISATPGTRDVGLPIYKPPPPTQLDRELRSFVRRFLSILLRSTVEFADLAVIDLSKIATDEGRAELTEQVRRAMHEVG